MFPSSLHASSSFFFLASQQKKYRGRRQPKRWYRGNQTSVRGDLNVPALEFQKVGQTTTPTSGEKENGEVAKSISCVCFHESHMKRFGRGDREGEMCVAQKWSPVPVLLSPFRRAVEKSRECRCATAKHTNERDRGEEKARRNGGRTNKPHNTCLVQNHKIKRVNHHQSTQTRGEPEPISNESAWRSVRFRKLGKPKTEKKHHTWNRLWFWYSIVRKC